MTINRSDAVTFTLLFLGIAIAVSAWAFQETLFPIERNPPDDLPVHPSLAQLPDGPRPAAPIHLLEYGDYQCPNTKAQHDVLKRILAEFGQSVNYVRRDFPLNIHPDSTTAAWAALCVKKIAPSSHAAFEDVLYDHQSVLQLEHLLDYAEGMGVDRSAFASCIQDPAIHSQVSRDLESAILEGVRGTPTLFINGKPFEGFQPYAKLRVIIETLLEEHQQKE